MYVSRRYHLPKQFKQELRERPVNWGFGQLSEAVFYRTYSRLDDTGGQETWADTVIRVVEGVLSIRQDHLMSTLGVSWDESAETARAEALAEAMFNMKILPPGRGLWAMGTEFVYERGSHALNNCGYIEVGSSLADAADWLMDSLMCGVGVGFSTNANGLRLQPATGGFEATTIPDTREGWAASVRQLIRAFETGAPHPHFDYSQIRSKGAPIRGFGGVSAGPGPLVLLHERLSSYLWDAVQRGGIVDTRLVADVMNAIGACVVSGNVRRSAEIALGDVRDSAFLNLKNYELNPERSEIGWMSNNSVVLSEPGEFEMLRDVTDLVASNGEPGIFNLMNAQKYGRNGERMEDLATGLNPCGEIPLESAELCNLVEVFPTRCGATEKELQDAVELATFYASTVSLLRSHRPETNAVVSRNRRIGVSVSGVADWIDETSIAHVFGSLNRAYEQVVRPVNAELAAQAGVPASVRVTTVKPSGTISLLAGVSPGVHWPVAGYVLRRIRIAQNSPIADRLAASGIPHEPDVVSADTEVFEFPLRYGSGRTRSVKSVSVYEQAATVAMLQRCWADNAVSNTLTVQPDETPQIPRVLELFAPQVKSLSMLPDIEGGAYAQMPLEKITKSEFDLRTLSLENVEWGNVQTDGVGSKYCDADHCEI